MNQPIRSRMQGLPDLASRPYLSPVIGLLAGLASLTVPLLRDLHWESAGVASLIIAFYAGIQAAGGRQSVAVIRNGAGLLTGWAFPLLIYAIITRCFSADGLAYWLFGPFPAMLFGWAVGRTAVQFQLHHSVFWTLSILLAVTLLPTIAEFMLFPQLFFFNHVWSYWPGPIYDELVPFDARLLYFRGITLLWVITLWAVPAVYTDKMLRWLVVLAAAGIMMSYLHLSDLGLISPEVRLQNELGSVHETEHFRIFYTTGTAGPEDENRWENIHEDHLLELTEELHIDPVIYRKNKIHSYIYHNTEQKKRLTGAGQTSYVPVWIPQDQTHITRQSLGQVLKHELTHVVAKQFGNWFGASTRIGLVEGLAVALDQNRYMSPIDKLVAVRENRPETEDLRRLFSPLGFYRVAGPVSYVISGSFVSHLLRNYPPELFKVAYRTGDIELAYAPQTLEDLSDEWHQYLDGLETGEEDSTRAAALFRTPSIFDKPCPRIESQQQIRAHIVQHLPEKRDLLLPASPC